MLIVGAGLAGACAAFRLSATHDVTVLEARHPSAGASGAAAGLANPLMGRRARPAWRWEAALDALQATIDAADAEAAVRAQGLLRPAVADDQVAPFQEAAAALPDLATWHPAEAVAERFPGVEGHGALRLHRGGAIDIPAFVERLLEAAEARGAAVHAGVEAVYWGERPGTAYVDVLPAGDSEAGPGASPDAGPAPVERLTADGVLLALGQGFPSHPELANLGLTGVRGQTVRVRWPDGLSPSLPPLSGSGYVVPDGDTLILGSSYSNAFDDLDPDPEQTAYIVDKTSRMLPAVADAEVLDVAVGVRVKTKSTNRPIVGPLPGRSRIWTLTALGSKGLLTAPLLAQHLPDWLQDPAAIPADVRVPGGSGD
jgi:glycine oxidase